MMSLWLTLIAAFLLSIVLTPMVRALALRIGLVDLPDGRRKMHDRAIPQAGGVAILIAASVAVMLSLSEFTVSSRLHVPWLFFACFSICAIGVLDDFGRLRGRHKLIGQLLVALLVIWSGVLIRHVSLLSWHLDLGYFAVPFTLFWLLGAINSLNLLDGMDGLLTLIGIVACAAFASIALLSGQLATVLIAAAMIGALAGFLVFNWPPATIFLGDSGSMLIGLAVGVLAIESSTPPNFSSSWGERVSGSSVMNLAAPLAVLCIPIFDTVAAIVRRKLTGRSIYNSDRSHLHHCLLQKGLPRSAVLACVGTCCIIAAAGAIASVHYHNDLFALIAPLAVVVLLVSTRMFGFAEFLLIKDWLQRLVRSFLRFPGAASVQRSEVHMQGSADWKQLVTLLVGRSGDLNLRSVCLDVNAPAVFEGYHANWQRFDGEPDDCVRWRADLPLTLQGQAVGTLSVTGYHDSEPIWQKIADLTSVVKVFEESMLIDSMTKVEARSTDGGLAGLHGAPLV